MVEPGEDAGEGAGVIGDGVGEDVEAEGGEAGRVAVGVEDEGRELGAEAVDDVGEDGAAGERLEGLVAAAHASGEAAGEDHAECGGHGGVRGGMGRG